MQTGQSGDRGCPVPARLVHTAWAFRIVCCVRAGTIPSVPRVVLAVPGSAGSCTQIRPERWTDSWSLIRPSCFIYRQELVWELDEPS